MRRRFRKRKPQWFPVIGTGTRAPEGNDNFNQRVFTLSIDPIGNQSIAITPIIPDKQVEAEDLNVNDPGQLVQHLGNAYELERIVGKLFAGASAPRDGGAGEIFPKVILLGAGFFVARQADNSAGGGSDLPIGAASVVEQVENYSPLSEDTIREPWIWRRTWVLWTGRNDAGINANNGGFAGVVDNLGATFPAAAGAPRTTMGYGSVMDGPHIDAKSGRRVNGDERLFFAVAARSLDGILGGPDPDALLVRGIQGVLDFRVLGWLRKATNRSTF